MSKVTKQALKDKLESDLQNLMSAFAIEGSSGTVEVDGPMRLALFNAMKPLIMKNYRNEVKKQVAANAGSAAQMDIVDKIAEGVVENQVKAAVGKIKDKVAIQKPS